MSICGKLDFFLKIPYYLARQPCCSIFRFRRLEMKKFVSLFAIFLVALLATTTVNAQDNRAVALYAIGGTGISSSTGDSYGSGSLATSQIGVGVDFNPEGFGIGLRFTNSGSPITQSVRREDPGGLWYTGDQIPYMQENIKTKSRLFTAMLQKGFGSQKVKFILGAGPGVIMSKSDSIATVGYAPPGYTGMKGYSTSNSSQSLIGAFGGTVVIRAGKNFDVRFGVQYLRGFTGDKSSYIMPVGGVGIGF